MRSVRELSADYQRIRRFTERLSAPLSAEDCAIQSMPDVSPTRWHLAHTTWFFETFALDGEEVFDPRFNYLFNSYYNQVGAQFPRAQRGLLSRPGLEEVRRYRAAIDQRMAAMLRGDALDARLAAVIELGLQHEQQHQELMLTDIKHVLFCNPAWPVYENSDFLDGSGIGEAGEWIAIEEGVYEVGHSGAGFSFDNETPRHKVYLHEAALAPAPVSCGDYLAFIEDGGYERPEHWLSLGWATARAQDWRAPLYWVQREGRWMQFTLAGMREIDPRWPVCHVSYFEADAYARWAGMRLPTEFEWEAALAKIAAGNGGAAVQFADRLLAGNHAIHPTAALGAEETTARMLGGVWEWTSSSYAAYPGYRPPPGALGEYNGKFMCNQYVLRGGSCATSADHLRPTYRNFFPPDARWQFSGLRLAR
ncbi:MAG: ergothioneine biosynthesis protein EgtB [Blastocatellia bacterium]|nr:ergothioneine biosynthesis protein EgtB [Blastocatellia bacterium]